MNDFYRIYVYNIYFVSIIILALMGVCVGVKQQHNITPEEEEIS